MGTEKMVVVVEVETASEPAYISAKEARTIAEAKRQADGRKIFESIIEAIPGYAKAGDMKHSFRIDGDFTISTEQTAVVLLEQLGYKVKITRTSTRTFNWYDVQW